MKIDVMTHDLFIGARLREILAQINISDAKYDTLNRYFVALALGDADLIKELSDTIVKKEYYKDIDITQTIINFKLLTDEWMAAYENKGFHDLYKDYES